MALRDDAVLDVVGHVAAEGDHCLGVIRPPVHHEAEEGEGGTEVFHEDVQHVPEGHRRGRH